MYNTTEALARGYEIHINFMTPKNSENNGDQVLSHFRMSSRFQDLLQISTLINYHTHVPLNSEFWFLAFRVQGPLEIASGLSKEKEERFDPHALSLIMRYSDGTEDGCLHTPIPWPSVYRLLLRNEYYCLYVTQFQMCCDSIKSKTDTVILSGELSWVDSVSYQDVLH